MSVNRRLVAPRDDSGLFRVAYDAVGLKPPEQLDYIGRAFLVPVSPALGGLKRAAVETLQAQRRLAGVGRRYLPAFRERARVDLSVRPQPASHDGPFDPEYGPDLVESRLVFLSRRLGELPELFHPPGFREGIVAYYVLETRMQPYERHEVLCLPFQLGVVLLGDYELVTIAVELALQID